MVTLTGFWQNDVKYQNTRLPQLPLPTRNHQPRPLALPVWSNKSCGLAVAVFQQSTQSFLSTSRCSTRDFLARPRHQELIAFSLMMAFLLVWSIGDRTGER